MSRLPRPKAVPVSLQGKRRDDQNQSATQHEAMNKEIKVVPDVAVMPTKGSVGLRTQLPGMATTISGIAQATGGIGEGNQIQSAI